MASQCVTYVLGTPSVDLINMTTPLPLTVYFTELVIHKLHYQRQTVEVNQSVKLTLDQIPLFEQKPVMVQRINPESWNADRIWPAHIGKPAIPTVCRM